MHNSGSRLWNRLVTTTMTDALVTSHTYNGGGLLESVQAVVRGVAASPPAVFIG